MGQIVEAIAKAILVTLVTTLAAIAVEKIRQHNDNQDEDGYFHPGDDEYDLY